MKEVHSGKQRKLPHAVIVRILHPCMGLRPLPHDAQ